MTCRLAGALLTCTLVGCVEGCSRGGWAAGWNDLRGDPYPLDEVSRSVSDPQAPCPEVSRQRYEGKLIPLAPPAQVAPAFAARLRRMEQAVATESTRMYGRRPRRIVHVGTYVCRPVRGRTGRWSEHALANAIDVVGFDFGRAPRDVDAGLPEFSIAGAFKVRVGRHWSEADHRGELLRRIVTRLKAQDVFRSMIGPGHPRHDNHLHFDMSPWRFMRL